MRFRVLDSGNADDFASWVELWGSWPNREIMGHPEYARLFARPCDRAVCAVGEEEGGATILFPLVVRPLRAEPWACPGERRWDAISPYGYGGPFAWGEGRREDAEYWTAFASWCREERIVSTFARLSLFPAQLAHLPVPLELRGPNVVVSLEAGLDAIWTAYDRNVRNNVRAARRGGVEVEVDRSGARLDAFIDIYSQTMLRRCASAWYHFPREFFQAIVERLEGHYAFFHALLDGKVLSSELVLCSEQHVYPFLGGTNADAFKLRPNDLLKHHTFEWAVAQGKKACVLGGGYAPDDGILRHKRAFAPGGDVPFSVACLVHDMAAYEDLMRARVALARQERKIWAPQPDFFPAYRAREQTDATTASPAPSAPPDAATASPVPPSVRPARSIDLG